MDPRSNMKAYSTDPSFYLVFATDPYAMSSKRGYIPTYLQFRSKQVTTFVMIFVLLLFWKNIILDIWLAASKNHFLQKPDLSLSPIANRTLGVISREQTRKTKIADRSLVPKDFCNCS